MEQSDSDVEMVEKNENDSIDSDVVIDDEQASTTTSSSSSSTSSIPKIKNLNNNNNNNNTAQTNVTNKSTSPKNMKAKLGSSIDEPIVINEPTPQINK
jgi:hypothetical protein